MIELFEKPKTITMKQFLEDSKKDYNLKYIEKFEYGDYDNWVTAVIETIDISLLYTHKVETHITLGECYCLSIKTSFKCMSDIKNDGYKKAQIEYGFHDSYVKNVEDILNEEITVIGVYKDE